MTDDRVTKAALVEEVVRVADLTKTRATIVTPCSRIVPLWPWRSALQRKQEAVRHPPRELVFVAAIIAPCRLLTGDFRATLRGPGDDARGWGLQESVPLTTGSQ